VNETELITRNASETELAVLDASIDRTSTKVAELDAQVAELNAQLMADKRRRNALLPISRLPVELLTRVLIEAASLIHKVNEWPFRVLWFLKGPTVKAAIALSHVCHAWRAHVLLTPALWTTPLFGQTLPDDSPLCGCTTPVRGAHMLYRAQRSYEGSVRRFLPLAILTPSESENEVVLNELPRLVDDVQHLWITMKPEHTHELSRPAPMLESLLLRRDMKGSSLLPMRCPQPAPKLTSLALIDVTAPIPADLLVGLIRLALIYNLDYYDNDEDEDEEVQADVVMRCVDHALDTVELALNIENLEIQFENPNRAFIDLERDMLSLHPNLRIVDAFGDDKCVSTFLCHLPLATVHEVSFRWGHHDDPEISRLVDFVATLSEADGETPGWMVPTRMRLAGHGDRLMLYLEDSAGAHVYTSIDRPPSIRTWEFVPTIDLTGEDLHRAVRLQNLRSLELELNHTGDEDIRLLLESFQNTKLETLRFSSGEGWGLTHALTPTTDVPLPLPALRTLTLVEQHMTWQQSPVFVNGEARKINGYVLMESTVAALLSALRERAAAGLVLETLILENCSFSRRVDAESARELLLERVEDVQLVNCTSEIRPFHAQPVAWPFATLIHNS
jgi:hypothetical protein